MAALPRTLDPRWRAAFTDRERVWAALRHLDRAATAAVVFQAAGIGLGATVRMLKGWADRGLLLTEVNSTTRYAMTKAARRHDKPPMIEIAKKRAPVPRRSGRQRLWSAMRVLKTFDLKTLCMASETEERNTQVFLHALLVAHYIAFAGKTPSGQKIFRLLQDTGPLHPVISRRAAPLFTSPVLHDRNTGRIHDLAPARRHKGKPAFEDGGIS